MRLVLFLAFVTLVSCALPPGYEDELYCPPGSCREPNSRPPGWCGPRTAFSRCRNMFSGALTPVRAWGDKLDVGVKDRLLAEVRTGKSFLFFPYSHLTNTHSGLAHGAVRELVLQCDAVAVDRGGDGGGRDVLLRSLLEGRRSV